MKIKVKGQVLKMITAGEWIDKVHEITDELERNFDLEEVELMEKIKLKPCRYCGKTNIVIERWSSGGMMYMVKCNNTDCPVPAEGYPAGRNPEKVKEEWNSRQG